MVSDPGAQRPGRQAHVVLCRRGQKVSPESANLSRKVSPEGDHAETCGASNVARERGRSRKSRRAPHSAGPLETGHYQHICLLQATARLESQATGRS